MPAPVDITDPFRALADPTRRAILDLLASGALPVQAIAGRFPGISRPAVSKHLRVLREGGLVTEERSGRERYYRVEPEPVREALEWMSGVQREALRGRRRGRAGSGKSATPEVASAATRRPRPARKRKTPTRKPPDAPTRPAPEGDDWKAW